MDKPHRVEGKTGGLVKAQQAMSLILLSRIWKKANQK